MSEISDLLFHCPTCNSTEGRKEGTHIKCLYCGNVYRASLLDEPVYVDLRQAVTARQEARFDAARRRYDRIIEDHPKDPSLEEAYWGRFLCEQNVIFYQNENGDSIPSFWEVNPEHYSKSKSYRKAIEYGEKSGNRENYERLAELIETYKQKYAQVKKEEPDGYQIFLCFKDSGTHDRNLGYEIYNKLSSKYRIFFSPQSLNDIAGNDYEPYIYHALRTSKVLLLICSDRDAIESKWVHNEWWRFYKFSQTSERTIVPVFRRGFAESQLPQELRTCQGHYENINLISDLSERLSSILRNNAKASNNTFEREMEEIEDLWAEGFTYDADIRLNNLIHATSNRPHDHVATLLLKGKLSSNNYRQLKNEQAVAAWEQASRLAAKQSVDIESMQEYKRYRKKLLFKRIRVASICAALVAILVGGSIFLGIQAFHEASKNTGTTNQASTQQSNPTDTLSGGAVTSTPTEPPTDTETVPEQTESDSLLTPEDSIGSSDASESVSSEYFDTEGVPSEETDSEELPIYSDSEEGSVPPVIPPASDGTDTYTDLDNYLYKAYVRSSESGNGAFYCEDFWVDTYSSDPLTYAVYQRNLDIEDTYNCRIRQIDSTTQTMYDEMKQSYLDGETYELAILLASDAATCQASALLKDIYSLENIDTAHASYDKNAVEQFTFDGKLYYLSGDMNISTMDSAAVTIFNTELYRCYDFGTMLGNDAYNDLYKMVDDGLWTVDAMLAMANFVSTDADNSGGALDATTGDTVGYFQYTASAQYYFFGCGARLSTLCDADGAATLLYGNEKAKEAFNFLYSRLNTALNNPTMPVGASFIRKNNFETGETLFTDLYLWDIRIVYHENDYNYGILPIPKMSAGQERYYDIVFYPYQTAHLWSIPVSCANESYASFLFHVMAVFSSRKDSTMDSYISKTLKLSVAQDATARATMGIIKNSLTYDVALLYNWGDFATGTLGSIYQATSNGYENATKSQTIKEAQTKMDATIEGFRNPQLPVEEEPAA